MVMTQFFVLFMFGLLLKFFVLTCVKENTVATLWAIFFLPAKKTESNDFDMGSKAPFLLTTLKDSCFVASKKYN